MTLDRFRLSRRVRACRLHFLFFESSITVGLYRFGGYIRPPLISRRAVIVVTIGGAWAER